VLEDFSSGARSGVNGMPSLVIERMRHDGPYDFESLLAVLEAWPSKKCDESGGQRGTASPGIQSGEFRWNRAAHRRAG
jgi:hypothetical protein